MDSRTEATEEDIVTTLRSGWSLRDGAKILNMTRRAADKIEEQHREIERLQSRLKCDTKFCDESAVFKRCRTHWRPL